MAEFLRLRQICLVAADLSAVEKPLSAALGAEVCYRDPGVGKYGLHNALFALGGTFLEVVAPTRPETAAGRYLQRRGGDGGYMFILDCEDVAPWRGRCASAGARIVEDVYRPESDGAFARALHLHPRDTGGCILSIDQHSGGEDMFGDYLWAGCGWTGKLAEGPVLRIEGAEIQTPDPDALARRWSEILRRPVSTAETGAPEIRLDHGFARFLQPADDRGEGLASVMLSCRDRDAALALARAAGLEMHKDGYSVCGVRFRLTGAA